MEVIFIIECVSDIHKSKHYWADNSQDVISSHRKQMLKITLLLHTFKSSNNNQMMEKGIYNPMHSVEEQAFNDSVLSQ